MHLLPCPDCDTKITVSPSQAGGTARCPNCQSQVAIPKLGDLRKLPQTETSRSSHDLTRGATSGGRQIAFLVLGAIGSMALLTAAFCWIRWYLVDVPINTEQHIALTRQEYIDASPATLIRAYEKMEEFGLDNPIPFTYVSDQAVKDDWRLNASIASLICGLALSGVVLLGVTGRGKAAT